MIDASCLCPEREVPFWTVRQEIIARGRGLIRSVAVGEGDARDTQGGVRGEKMTEIVALLLGTEKRRRGIATGVSEAFGYRPERSVSGRRREVVALLDKGTVRITNNIFVVTSAGHER